MRTIIYICLCCLCLSAWSETRTWTLKDGKTFEGEFLSLVGKKVSIRNLKGRTQQILLPEFSDEDVVLIQLLKPPKLDFDFTKNRELRRFPAVLFGTEIPQSYRYNFSVTIKQTSTTPYNHELTAELFVIGRETYGNKRILLTHQEGKFVLEGYNSKFKLDCERTVELVTFYMGFGSYKRELGTEYKGYLAIVRDSRGEIIAYRTSSENLFENLENLKNLPVGAFFDKTCTRCSPTRPKPYRY